MRSNVISEVSKIEGHTNDGKTKLCREQGLCLRKTGSKNTHITLGKQNLMAP
jgi:hypothetical protein